MERKRTVRRRKTDEELRGDRIRKYKQRYNKTKVVEFKSKDEVNMLKHFSIDKVVVNGDWQSNMAMIIYPVLCSRADFRKNEWMQLSLVNIGKLAGISEPSVRKGINDLLHKTISYYKDYSSTETITVPLLERRKVTKGKRHFYQYKIWFLRNAEVDRARGGFIILQSLLFDTGIWAKLSKRAKLLYLALRKHARFDEEMYSYVEKTEPQYIHEMNFYERGWDVCDISYAELCLSAGIDTHKIKDNIRELEKVGLIEENGYLVYHMPKNMLKKFRASLK